MTRVAGPAYLAVSQGNPVADNTLVGSGGMPNPPEATITGLTASTSISDPDKPFMGALSGFAFYSGAQQPGAGSFMGGSIEAYAALTGSVTETVHGFEGIAFARHDGHYLQVVGNQGTAGVLDNCHVDDLIAVHARGPLDAGTGMATVGRSYSIKAQEPTVGTQRYTAFLHGLTRLVKGAAGHVLEIANASGLLQWASDGSTLKGYASDGASERVILDPRDDATARVATQTVGISRHIDARNWGSTVFAVDADGTVEAPTGVVLTSPNGSRFRLTVNDLGVLGTEPG